MARQSQFMTICLIWPSSVTLTFNLPEQLFQMALLLLKENNCAKLFRNSCINVQVMAPGFSLRGGRRPKRLPQTIFWPPQILFWAFKCIQMLKNWLPQTDFWPLTKILIENPVARASSIYDHLNHLSFKFDLDLQPNWTNVSFCTSTPQGQIILKSMCKCTSYDPDKLGWMHTCTMHVHTLNWSCMSHSPLPCSTKIKESYS